MPSKAQIRARKAFVKKYAKKGKGKSSKKGKAMIAEIKRNPIRGKKSHQMSMDKEYYLTFKGQKIPYEFTALKKTIVLDKNRRDFPPEVNKILKRKYPQITSIQHHSGYFTFD